MKVKYSKSMLGLDIETGCRLLVEEAKSLNCEVCMEFNDIELIANPNTNPAKLVDFYRDEMVSRRAEYEKSDEYKKLRERQNFELKQKQKELDELLIQLDTINFSDYTQVLHWWAKAQDALDHIGLVKYDAHIIQAFEKNGYVENEHVGKDSEWIKETPERMARYIVGQCLNMLKVVGAVHQIIPIWVKQYDELF